jgi:hypothetical protein
VTRILKNWLSLCISQQLSKFHLELARKAKAAGGVKRLVPAGHRDRDAVSQTFAFRDDSSASLPWHSGSPGIRSDAADCRIPSGAHVVAMRRIATPLLFRSLECDSKVKSRRGPTVNIIKDCFSYNPSVLKKNYRSFIHIHKKFFKTCCLLVAFILWSSDFVSFLSVNPCVTVIC